ncbi:MAG: Trk system potassium transporter TrkA [Clostridia bacterium]|nr:Trk system potassium transporter TrkA [Clostridia bacterium]
MRIVIVGLGKVGKNLTKMLSESGYDIVAVDSDPATVEEVTNLDDVLALCGNGASLEIQREAGVPESDMLIACTSNDEVNILCCLTAKKIGIRHTIARVRKPEYAEHVRLLREELGLSLAINPEKAVAREIARILRFPNATKVESFSKRRLDFVEYRIEAGSKLDGSRLDGIYAKFRVRVLICAVLRNKECIIPSGDFVLQADDVIYVAASAKEMERFFDTACGVKQSVRNVMIAGASRIARYLTEELSEAGIAVRVVDLDEERCREFSETVPKALVIFGDATDSELLQEEDLAQMDAFVALTGLDETNILLSLYAKGQQVKKTIAKVNRPGFTEFVADSRLVDTVVSTGPVVAEMIARYIRAMQSSRGGGVAALHHVADGKAEALEFRVSAGCSFAGVPFKELRLKKNLLIGGIVRQSGNVIIPGGNDALQPGDDVIVVTTDKTLTDLEQILA